MNSCRICQLLIILEVDAMRVGAAVPAAAAAAAAAIDRIDR